MALVPWKLVKADESQESSRSFTFRTVEGNVLSVSIEQDPSKGQRHHANALWDSAIVLSDWLACERRIVIEGKTFLEVGAGTGLVSIVLAKLSARRVVATDMEEGMSSLRSNLDSNGCSNVESSVLRWGSPIEHQDVDFVVLADCVFAEYDLSGLLCTLQSLCGKATTIIIGYKARLVGPEEAFFRKLRRSFAESHEWKQHGVKKDFEGTGVQIFTMVPK